MSSCVDGDKGRSCEGICKAIGCLVCEEEVVTGRVSHITLGLGFAADDTTGRVWAGEPDAAVAIAT